MRAGVGLGRRGGAGKDRNLEMSDEVWRLAPRPGAWIVCLARATLWLDR